MEELIKSVRIRPRQAPSGYKSESFKGGLLDIKISVVRTGKKERFCSAHKLNSEGEESGQFWYSLTYKGRRYEDLSDDDLIEDYVRTNTLRERPVEGEFVTIEGLKLPYYQIVQDPFEKIPPVSRVFGFDPYHLNNGAQLYIRWYSSEKKKVEWSYDDVTNASQSSIGEVSIRITTNQPERDPLFFTYSSSNNPLQAGVTPSYIDIESYWEYQSEQLTSLTSNNLIYLPPGEEFVDSDSLGIAGGTKYAIKSDANFAIDGFIESGDSRITSTSSLKPEGLVKRVEILPPDEHPIWVLSDKTSDSISVFDPIYKRDMGTNSNEKYFIDNSTNGSTNGLDWQIIGDLLSAWNKKIPGYNVELCSPAFLPNKKIDYKDPVAPIDETIAEDEKKAEELAAGASQSGKIKLNILFPNEFEVEARKDCPDFRIFVGDIPTELLPGEGFVFQDDFENLDELDQEYREVEFSGGEELQLPQESAEIDDQVAEQIKNDPVGSTEVEASPDGKVSSVASDTPGYTGTIGMGFNGVPYYCQGEARWGKKPYGSKCSDKPTVKSSGCGPTSLAMVINFWAKKGFCSPTTPYDICQLSDNNGGRVCGVGTALTATGLVKQIKEKFGLVMKGGQSQENLKAALKKGYPCIISGAKYGSKGKCYNAAGKQTSNTTPGHFVCLTGIDDQGRIRVNDPGYAATKAVAAFEANTLPSANMATFKQSIIIYPETKGSPV